MSHIAIIHPIMLAVLLLLSSGVARAEMWKCTDRDGNTRYENDKAKAKGCKPLTLDPIDTSAQKKPRLELVIEEPAQNTISCGLTKSGIESIAALTLRNNGIQPIQGFALALSLGIPYLYVQVSALMPVSMACVFNINVAVRTYISLPQGKGGFKPRTPLISANLCEKSGVGSASQGNAATHFSNSLENTIKLCLGELDY